MWGVISLRMKNSSPKLAYEADISEFRTSGGPLLPLTVRDMTFPCINCGGMTKQNRPAGNRTRIQSRSGAIGQGCTETTMRSVRGALGYQDHP